MRRLSCVAQLRFIAGGHRGEVDIDDQVLPAASELAGPAAIDVLRPAVDAARGVLHDARCVHVHYVPGRELVARYDCDITWPDGRRRDTLLAAATPNGTLPGALVVQADTSASTLLASVWRWPFDPILPGLEVATAPSALTSALAPAGVEVVAVDVVAYRPTERAVAKVVAPDGVVRFLKVVPPALVAGIAERHAAVRAAGVAAPAIEYVDHRRGLLLMAALDGRTLRDRIKAGATTWPDPVRLERLLDVIADIDPRDVGDSSRAARSVDAIAHAALLHEIVPECGAQVEPLLRTIESSLPVVASRTGAVVHGDLHEAQLFLDEAGGVTGLVDLDDLGRGDPVDDPAVLIAHLIHRGLVSSDARVVGVVRPGIQTLRRQFGRRHGTEALDLTTAAVLLGLATGPFRSQAPDWRCRTRTVVDAAVRVADGDEGILTDASGALQAEFPRCGVSTRFPGGPLQ